jgi:branched-chain amino acid transport system permease protein
MRKSIFNVKTITLFVCIVLFTIIVPRVTNTYSMTVMNTALIYFIASLGISVLLGMGGNISFATCAFMGFGAFVTTNLSVKLGIHSVISMVLAVVATCLFSWVMGLILLRLKGSYFTFATIGLVQIMWSIYTNFKPFSGGPDGISRIPRLDFIFYKPRTVLDYFYVLMIFAVLCGVIVERLRKTSLGRSLASIRDNEIAAQSLGVNVYRTNVIGFIISGAFAGLAGALLAHHNTFISASQFTFEQSTMFVIMVMLGGVSSTPGAFIGAMIVTMLPEWLRPLKEYIRFVYGIGIMILMVFMPMGLAGVAKSITNKLKKNKIKKESGVSVDGASS